VCALLRLSLLLLLLLPLALLMLLPSALLTIMLLPAPAPFFFACALLRENSCENLCMPIAANSSCP
jgi:hypothetical protein